MWDSAYQDPLGLNKNQDQQDNTDPQQEAFESSARERYEYCINVAKIFKGPAGRAILKQWRKATIESSSWIPSLAQQTSIEAANAHAYAREGQNAFVSDIEKCIEIAHNCKTLEDFYSMINQVGTGNNI